MSAIAASLFSLPWAQYRRVPTFYLWYDAFYAALALAGIAAIFATGYRGPFADLRWWFVPAFPVFLYGQLRFAQRLPVLIAMAVLLMLGTVALTLVALRIRGRDD